MSGNAIFNSTDAVPSPPPTNVLGEFSTDLAVATPFQE
jgi:hypothetical protein